MNFFRRNLFLYVLILLPFARVLNFDYVNYDDGTFIGIANRGFVFAEIFGKFQLFDYIPLTHLSFILEKWIMGGMYPEVSHAINLGLHLINSILVFHLASRLFRDEGLIPYFVVLAFALHPMNIESVAWVTERKGLLAASFYLGALLVYLRRLEYLQKEKRESPRLAFATVGLFVLALLSKPVALSLPLVLLVLDYWTSRSDSWKRMILEKVPILILVLVFGWIHSKARNSFYAMEFSPGLLGEVTALMPKVISHYLSGFLYPTGLNVFYTERNLQVTALGTLLFVGFVVLALGLVYLGTNRSERNPTRVRSDFPDAKRILVGSVLWFFIVLGPHLKIIPYGLSFVAADRYFYLSGLGLLFLLGFVLREIFSVRKWVGALLAGGVLLSWQMQFFGQLSSWEDSGTLWTRVVETDPKSALAHNNLGLYYLDEKKVPLAVKHFELSAQADPAYSHPWVNMAYIAAQNRDLVRARDFLREGLKRNPGSTEILESLGRIEKALAPKSP